MKNGKEQLDIEHMCEKSSKTQNLYENTIQMFVAFIENKDPETGTHIKRVAQMTKELALEFGLNADDAQKLGTDSLLHDLGKLAIPDSVLLSPKKLSEKEYEIMKGHAKIGAEIIGKHKCFYQARQIALSHHEKWDGTGYPEGLKADAIPLAARIVTVADLFDALISNRHYSKPWPLDKAVKKIKEGSGNNFDPKIVEAFLSLYKKSKLNKYTR